MICVLSRAYCIVCSVNAQNTEGPLRITQYARRYTISMSIFSLHKIQQFSSGKGNRT
jgi:hypothetical protein